MKEFFVDFAGKDWLFLVLTLIGIFIGLEAIFNFRGKWKDWRATKSEERFLIRMREKTKLMNRVATYSKQPFNFFVDELEDTIRFLIFTLFSLALVGIYYLSNPITAFYPWLELILGAFLICSTTFGFLLERLRHIDYYRDSHKLLKDVRILVEEGYKKGWVSEEQYQKFIDGDNDTPAVVEKQSDT